jgi:hypothetical protein
VDAFPQLEALGLTGDTSQLEALRAPRLRLLALNSKSWKGFKVDRFLQKSELPSLCEFRAEGEIRYAVTEFARLFEVARFPGLQRVTLHRWLLSAAFFARAAQISPRPGPIRTLSLAYCELPEDVEELTRAIVSAGTLLAPIELHLPCEAQNYIEQLAAGGLTASFGE